MASVGSHTLIDWHIKSYLRIHQLTNELHYYSLHAVKGHVSIKLTIEMIIRGILNLKSC